MFLCRILTVLALLATISAGADPDLERRFEDLLSAINERRIAGEIDLAVDELFEATVILRKKATTLLSSGRFGDTNYLVAATGSDFLSCTNSRERQTQGLTLRRHLF
jgi:hypothetical protein